jgi:N-acetylmuramoyl-L-alanine amidase
MALCLGVTQSVGAVPEEPVIISRLMDRGFVRTRRALVDTIVIHSSYNSKGGDVYSVKEVIAIYRSYNVSAHYLIDRAGTIYRLVPEGYTSYHAGKSVMPDGRTGVNHFSIGIELLNKRGDTFTEAQYQSLRQLIVSVKHRHAIRHIVGHGAVAELRRSDPWNFDWKRIDDL